MTKTTKWAIATFIAELMTALATNKLIETAKQERMDEYLRSLASPDRRLHDS